ncbi:ComEC/Rec2 family competence protein [Nitratireductor sp. ZSWI3]|uniref:ComEC/Rec2 family competence protein n=1 Tax=Nitratireductor sp. ZSWI3 TaxID=2966359 RepID=UPI00215000B0|nr:ComEC/Rec2 family competence protein [Nitratireductor sp. ZSWI3]MCR4267300.1 ComEC family competence protein [Nitratireductor sp. ZSWI3]
MGSEAATKERDERALFGLDERPVRPPVLAPRESQPIGAGPRSRLLAGSLGWRKTGVQALSAAMAAEEGRGTAFLWLPVLLCAGALVYFILPAEPPGYAIASGLALCACGVVLARRRMLARTALAAALVVLLGLAAGKVEAWRAGTPMLGSEVTTYVTGRVLSIEPRADGRTRLTVHVTRTERPQLRYPPDRVRLTARNLPAGLLPGDGVTGLARLMPPSGPVRPLAYDFSFESYFDGIGAIGFYLRDPQPANLPAAATLSERLSGRLQRLREAFAARLRDRISGPEGEVAAALITGLRAGIPKPVEEALRRAGLAHVLAISGLHMALVAFTVMAAMRSSFALFPGFSSRHPVKKYAAGSALLVCALYLFVSGAAVAAQRSFIMLAIMLAALLFDRAALTMRNLALAALVVVAVSPHEVVGPGFQMSFAATAALIAGYAAWNDRRERRLARRAPPPDRSFLRKAVRTALLYLGGLVLTSLIAGTATALYGTWHFQRASPLALGANLAAMPLVSLVVMPSAVAAVFAMPFNLDGAPLAAMGWGISAVIDVATWFSDHTPFDATGMVPLSATLTLTAALVLLTMATTRLRLLAVPLIAAGGVLLLGRDLPDALVSEDARLVALGTADGALAVNRARPNGFTSENWLRMMQAGEMLRPVLARTEPTAPPDGAGFACGSGICLARHATGAIIAHVAAPQKSATPLSQLEALCRLADLLVIEDATLDDPCGKGSATVITGRALARRGSAAIEFGEVGRGQRRVVSVDFAIGEPFRPWHAQRHFSRAARGLAPNPQRTGDRQASAGDTPARRRKNQ